MKHLLLPIFLLIAPTTLACEQFRWFEGGPGPEDDVNGGMVLVPDGFEGASCFDSGPANMRENLVLRVSNQLDSDYMLTVNDGTGTVFERLVIAGTASEQEIVPLYTSGLGVYRVTMTVTEATASAYLTAQVVDYRDDAQRMDVMAYKHATAWKPPAHVAEQRYEDRPFERVQYPSEAER